MHTLAPRGNHEVWETYLRRFSDHQSVLHELADVLSRISGRNFRNLYMHDQTKRSVLLRCAAPPAAVHNLCTVFPDVNHLIAFEVFRSSNA